MADGVATCGGSEDGVDIPNGVTMVGEEAIREGMTMASNGSEDCFFRFCVDTAASCCSGRPRA